MLYRGSVPALAAAGFLLLTGCGQHTTTSTVKPPARRSATPASGTLVGIRGGTLIPRHLIVIVGHPVQWENFDAVVFPSESGGSGAVATRGHRG